MTIPRDHYRTIDVTVDAAKGIVQVLTNRWWWCVDGTPTKAIFYHGADKRRYPGSRQCNTQKEITERIVPNVENAKLIFIEKAFVPWEDD